VKPDSGNNPIVRADGLRHSYGDTTALNGISLEIRAGEFFGLLGPNGAGKTTTISILSALLRPDAGAIHIGGYDLLTQPARVKQLTGVVPQEIALYEELTAFQNLLFWGRLYGVDGSESRRRATQLLGMVGLENRMHETVAHYSGGMKRRVNLAAALMHSPSLLLMDEPTVGIDPQSRNHIFDLLGQLHSEGISIIYTTHYMEEVERLCSRAAIIDNGKIIADGSMEELKSLSARHAGVDIELLPEERQDAPTLRLPEGMPVEHHGQHLHFRTPTPQKDLPAILQSVMQAGLKVHKVEIQAPNLESVFLDLTGRKLRDGSASEEG